MQIARRALSSSKHFTHYKRAFSKILDVEQGSNANGHRRLFATSAAVDIPKIKKSRKAVSRDERKAMVESFVNEYRAMNGGKLPSVSAIQDQVGGSYYTLKNIFQELIRNPAGSKVENVQEKKVDTAKETSTNTEDVSENFLVIDGRICHDDHSVRLHDVDTVDLSLKTAVEKERMEYPSCSDKLSSEVVVCETKDDYSSPVGKQEDIVEREPEVASNKCPNELENDLEMKSPSEGVLDLDHSKPKYDHHEKSPESAESVQVDLAVKQQSSSSVWGNIKSLAGGIINLWKKF